MNAKTIGLDIAKIVFQVHGLDRPGPARRSCRLFADRYDRFVDLDWQIED